MPSVANYSFEFNKPYRINTADGGTIVCYWDGKHFRDSSLAGKNKGRRCVLFNVFFVVAKMIALEEGYYSVFELFYFIEFVVLL